jgi:hypothetical protein
MNFLTETELVNKNVQPKSEQNKYHTFSDLIYKVSSKWRQENK